MTRQNENRISSAFARLKASKDATVKDGMVTMMRAGLDALMEAHDTPIIGKNIYHHNELERETLGWMVFHDGVEVASGTQDQGDIPGAVLFRLEAAGYGTTGWVGILMSDMAFDWYRVDYEIDFLKFSEEEIKSSFGTYFRRVATP